MFIIVPTVTERAEKVKKPKYKKKSDYRLFHWREKMKKQLIVLKEDLPDYDLKTGHMGVVDSLDKEKTDVVFFTITDFKNKKAETKELKDVDTAKLMRIEDFYTTDRLKSNSILTKILLLLYSPIGITLVLTKLSIAFFMLFIAMFIPALRFNNKFVVFLSYIAGWFPVIENKEEFNKSDAKVVVSNHVSLVDHTVFQPFNKAYFLANKLSEQNLLYKIFFPIFVGGLFELKKGEPVPELAKRVDELLEENPSAKLAVFPEGTVHNGEFLHFFHSFAFSLGDSVLPATVKISSIFPIYYYPFAKNQVCNLLWTLFLPYNIYRCKLLPTVYREKRETKEDFAYRVQQLMADDLGVLASCVSNKHKRLYTKNREFYLDPAFGIIDELQVEEQPRHSTVRPRRPKYATQPQPQPQY